MMSEKKDREKLLSEIMARDEKDGLYFEDPIVGGVVKDLWDRSSVGVNKYGITLKDNNTDDFLQHLYEELLDAALYIKKLKDEKK